MKVYIAGRVTGEPRDMVIMKFAGAEALLRASNHDPVNPTKLVKMGVNHKEAMKICFNLLLECDAILLLNDWAFSEGAQIEAQTARYAEMHIINEDDLL